MSAYPSILDAQTLARLKAPTVPVDQMPSANTPLAGAPAPVAPSVALRTPTAEDQTNSKLLGDQQELQRLTSTGTGISQIKNPLLRGLAHAGDIAESVLLPSAAKLTPGTTLNHNRLLNQQTGIVNNDLANQSDQAKTQQEQALTNYTQQRPEIEQSKIDQKQTAVQERVAQAAAAKGQLVSWDANGLPSFTDDHNSQAFHDNQALAAMHEATAQKSAILSDIQKNHYIPGTPEFIEAQKKLSQTDQKIQVAMGMLGARMQGMGIQRERLDLNEDKQYNPQPTAIERSKGDLAQSAVERVQEMRAIKDAHPEWFGPAAGRASNVQAAIGSQAPDMQRYLSAAQYLSDHSAGVFGGRGKYITEQLHSLTDPHMNPAALGGALDEAEKAAQGFVKAGTIHGKGGTSGYSGGSAPAGAPKAGDIVDGYRFKGGNAGDQNNWEKQ